MKLKHYHLQPIFFFGGLILAVLAKKVITGTGSSGLGESVTTAAAKRKQSTRHERGNT
jgi:hypothetical protein